MTVHVHPVGDTVDHDTDTTDGCPCGPHVEYIDPEDGTTYPDGPLVIHHSADGREFTDAVPQGDGWISEETP